MIGNRDIERPENSPVDCFQRDGAGRPVVGGLPQRGKTEEVPCDLLRASVAIKACSVTKGDLFSHLLRKCQLPHRGSLLDSPPSTWAPPPPSFGPGLVYSSAGVDKSPRPTYNKDEERTTHAVAPQMPTVSLCDPFGSRKQPSLVGVAVVFYLPHVDRD